MKVSSVLVLLLTSTLVLPLGFYGAHADDQPYGAIQTGPGTTQTGTQNNPTNTNATNSGATQNMGIQVSEFVHNATALFQQQRAENIQTIKDCHKKMDTATPENKTRIMNECRTILKSIKEKYQDARKQFQELFKQFRYGIIILRHDAQGLKISDEDKKKAMKNIDDGAARHGLKGITIAGVYVGEMGDNGTRGLEKALKHVNETNDEKNENYSQNDDRGTHGKPTKTDKPGSDE